MPTYIIGTPGVDTLVIRLTRTGGLPDNYRAETSTGELLESRACTAAESTQITTLTNGDSLRTQARDALAALRASVDSLQAVADKTNAQIGPADTKTVARETRRVARQLIAVTRLVVDALDSADTGTA